MYLRERNKFKKFGKEILFLVFKIYSIIYLYCIVFLSQFFINLIVLNNIQFIYCLINIAIMLFIKPECRSNKFNISKVIDVKFNFPVI